MVISLCLQEPSELILLGLRSQQELQQHSEMTAPFHCNRESLASPFICWVWCLYLAQQQKPPSAPQRGRPQTVCPRHTGRYAPEQKVPVVDSSTDFFLSGQLRG